MDEFLKEYDGGRFKRGKSLAGGVISDVHLLEDEAKEGGDTSQLVIKKTTGLVLDAVLPPKFAPEDRWMLEIAPETHALDEQVKDVLRKDGMCVPETVHFNGYDISVMRDFGADGFTLLSNQLNERNIYLSEAICAAIGQSLVRVMNVLSTNTSLQPVEDTHRQFAQRIGGFREFLYGLERQDIYMRLYNACHADDNHLVWTDGHPKNIAVSDDQAMVFDFGRLVPWDSRYPLPNFLAQFFLIQWSNGKDGRQIIQEMKSIQAAYESEIHTSFTEDDHRDLIAYFCAELIGRIGGKWIKLGYSLGTPQAFSAEATIKGSITPWLLGEKNGSFGDFLYDICCTPFPQGYTQS